jgi:putative sterol carrier protein
MPSREELRQLFELQMQRFYEEKALKAFQGWTRTMQYFFTDIEEFWYVRVVNGKPGEPAEGRVEKPEVLYEMSSDTFAAIARREITGMKAYMQGKVKVKASMGDLMKLQKLD